MEEKKVKILTVQTDSKINGVEHNRTLVSDLIEANITNDVDLIVLPEVWTCGWEPSCFKDSAESLENSATIDFLKKLAKKYHANIIGGSFITKDIKCNYYNTCPIINRDGKLIATYNKMHLFSYFGADEGSYVKCGENAVCVTLDGIKYGISICYDIRFPELYRAYRKEGADILVDVAAWSITKPKQWEVLTKCRAVENQAFMIAVNQCGLIKGDENLGDSRVIDYLGNTISKIKKNRGCAISEIKLNDMYNFRKKCTILEDIQNKYEVKKI